MDDNNFTRQLTKADVEQFLKDFESDFVVVHLDNHYWSVLNSLYYDYKMTLTDFEILFPSMDNPSQSEKDLMLKSWRKFLCRKFKSYKEALINHLMAQVKDAILNLD